MKRDVYDYRGESAATRERSIAKRFSPHPIELDIYIYIYIYERSGDVLSAVPILYIILRFRSRRGMRVERQHTAVALLLGRDNTR